MGAGCCSNKSKVHSNTPELEWQDILKHQKLESMVPNKTIKTLAFQGIPKNLRWEVWQKLLRSTSSLSEYTNLLSSSTQDPQIDRDIHRTFPKNELISSDQGQASLKNLLNLLATKLPSGYWQGMNYITGAVLIESLGNEAESYFFLHSLYTSFNVISLFDGSFKILKKMCWMFHQTLSSEDEKLENYLKTLPLDDSLWIFKWFITLFTYSFPFQTVLRIWDAFLVKDLYFIVNIAVGIALCISKEIQSKSLEEVLEYLENIDIDISKALAKADSLKTELSIDNN